MTEDKKGRGNMALQVFRLETTVAVSVIELDVQVQSVHTAFIPLSDESRLRAAFESAGLIDVQVGYALQDLARTAKNKGFLFSIDQSQPTR